MVRIRTIKPEFWSDEKMSSLSPIDRLVFIGLIGMADDYGRVHYNVKVIDAFIFPNTDDSARDSLATLSRMSRVKIGQSENGMPILEILNWSKHQRVDRPQRQGSLPPIHDPNNSSRTETNENTDQAVIRESVANNSRESREELASGSSILDLGSRTVDMGEGEVSIHTTTPLEKKSKKFQTAWNRWRAHQRERFTPLTPTREEANLMALSRCFPDEAEQIAAIEFSIERGAKHLIINGDHKQAREGPNQHATAKLGRQLKPRGQELAEQIFGGQT